VVLRISSLYDISVPCGRRTPAHATIKSNQDHR
jgi:hypothetical protein